MSEPAPQFPREAAEALIQHAASAPLPGGLQQAEKVDRLLTAFRRWYQYVTQPAPPPPPSP